MNTICPGGIRTPMMDHFKETMPDIAAKALGGGRMAEPEEEANAAVMLNSPLASCVNGVNLRTDCGYLAGSWLVQARDIRWYGRGASAPLPSY